MDGKPSSLKVGDRVVYREGTSAFMGIVMQVQDGGAFIKPINEHGIRLLKREQWCPDGDIFVEEVNGESMF